VSFIDLPTHQSTLFTYLSNYLSTYLSINISTNHSFCQDYCLSYDRMEEIYTTQVDLLGHLIDLGLLSSIHDGLNINTSSNLSSTTKSSSTSTSLPSSSSTTTAVHHPNRNAMRSRLVAATFCAGLYPHVAKVFRPPKKFIEVAGMLSIIYLSIYQFIYLQLYLISINLFTYHPSIDLNVYLNVYLSSINLIYLFHQL
jgi:hypothetical protein